jgi:cytochrome c peroxidase
MSSCQSDPAIEQGKQIDNLLERAIEEAAHGEGLAAFQLPSSSDYANIPQDPNNPITTEKVKLGQLLYHETALGQLPKNEAGRGTYSCASCHFAAAGFQAGTIQGIGEGGEGIGLRGEERIMSSAYALTEIDVQPVRTPTTLHVAYQEVMLWNGQFGATGPNNGTESQWKEGTPIANNHLGYQGVETQAIAGLGVHRQTCNKEMAEQMGYDELFDEAFPTIDTSERYGIEYAALAIAAYERTLLANEAPFQRWLRGEENAMTNVEKEGALLFFTKANCVSCHNGPSLSNMNFYALGMGDLDMMNGAFSVSPDDNTHKGRFSFTGKQRDLYKFKTPQLYNLKDSPFYGHGGSLTSLEEVVQYKNMAQGENQRVPFQFLDKRFTPLKLDAEEVNALVAFLETGLYDPNLLRYQPESVLSNQCIPNHDIPSRLSLGCE